LASTPQGQPDMFPEGNLFNTLQNGSKRAKLAWYMIATSFHNSNDPYMPTHIKDNPATISNHNVRQVLVTDIFKGKKFKQVYLILYPPSIYHFIQVKEGLTITM